MINIGWLALFIMIAGGTLVVWAIFKIDDVMHMRRLNKNWMAISKRMDEEEERVRDSAIDVSGFRE